MQSVQAVFVSLLLSQPSSSAKQVDLPAPAALRDADGRTPLHYLAAFKGNQHTPVVFVAAGGYAAVAFVTGCFASALPGWIGIKIATYTNYRCAHECGPNVTKCSDYG